MVGGVYHWGGLSFREPGSYIFVHMHLYKYSHPFIASGMFFGEHPNNKKAQSIAAAQNCAEELVDQVRPQRSRKHKFFAPAVHREEEGNLDEHVGGKYVGGTAERKLY